jgi:feruloyl esterase
VNTPACLTAPELTVVRTLYRGNFDARGALLEPRYQERGMEGSWPGGFWIPQGAVPPGSGMPRLGAHQWGDSAARSFSFPIGQGKPLTEVQLTADEVNRIAPQAAIYDAFNTNLRPFRDNGGKLMIYNGFYDTGQPPSLILTLYDGFRKEMGGQQELDKFVRLFMVPGMGHCGGGPSTNSSELLLQMVAWVENGQAPESVVSRQEGGSRGGRVGGVALQRPVYRYPLLARYVGPDPATNPNAPNDLANFRPAEPATKHVDHLDWVGASWIGPKAPRDSGKAP